jgi:alpha-tubulin suppressor-like RCC1 family protein
MRNLSNVACLFVAVGSLEGCVAATRAAPDLAPPEDAGNTDAQADGDREAGRDAGSGATRPDGSRDAAADTKGDAPLKDGGASGDAKGDAPSSDAADSAPPVEAGPTCDAGESSCSGACVDESTDPNHCGACATVCPSKSDGVPVCAAGACAIVCDAAYHVCGGVCDSNTSIDSCGGSCTPCSPPADSTATCDGTSCGFACDSGYHGCGGACDSNTSIESCGSSCTACPAPPANATATCDGTSCGFTCNAGTVLCASGTACCSNYLAAGDVHTCVLALATNEVECVGEGSSGQLGNSSLALELSPVKVVTSSGVLSGAIGVVAGYLHTCALTIGGDMYCWGDNTDGDVGVSLSKVNLGQAHQLGLSGVIAMAAGSTHTCAVLGSGGVDCWGNNDKGQLGIGSTTDEGFPQAVKTVSGVVGISGGNEHTCAVTSSGSAYCWGDNSKSQLGTSASPTTEPQLVGLSGVESIAAGSYHTCALATGGVVWCWGYNVWGQLGNGTESSIPNGTPTAIAAADFGGSPVVAIAASAASYHTCALTAAGAVYCWGQNYYGQIGDGTSGLVSNRPTPVQVTGLASGAYAIAAGSNHSCAAVTGRGILCWGADGSGQLSNGVEVMDELTPVTSTF